MTDLSAKLAGLTDHQRAELQRRLIEKRVAERRDRVIAPRSAPGPYPLSYAQELLWLMDQFNAGVAYNVPGARRLRGKLDENALRRAFGEIVARHEILRTRYELRDGQPVQVIDEPAGLPLEKLDLSHLEGGEQDRELQRLLRAESRKPFDLAKGPLIRSTLIKLGEDDHVYLGVVHHIAFDGWSRGVLYSELRKLYAGFRDDQPVDLPPPEIQYVDYALWQRGWMTADVLDSQLEFWRETLQGAPPALNLPTDRPRPARLDFEGERQMRMMAPELRDELKDLARRNNVTLFMLLLSAFATLLSRYSGQSDLVLGTPIAGRNRTEVENLIGYFTNTLALRCDLDGNPSFADLLQRTKAMATAAYAHQDLPFEKLVAELAPERDPSRSPIFQVLFVLQNATRASLDLAGLEGEAIRLDPGWSKFDITLGMGEHPEGLNMSWEYDTHLFDRTTIARLMDQFEILLRAIVEAPNRPVAELPLLIRHERDRILEGWNDTAVPFPEDRCVHELFEAQVARSPDAKAVMIGHTSLTYAELDARANQLAHHLRSLGVGPDVLVGLCLERSLEMAVAILGVLKAGGAYMPLDPSYPLDRLQLMLDDAEVRIVLTLERMEHTLPAHQGKVLRLDRDWPAIRSNPKTQPPRVVEPTNLAYVIYTSGSTGRPKGVMVEHRGLVNHTTAMAREFALSSTDRVLQFSSLSFDISVEEMMPAWSTGATVVLRSPELSVSGPLFLEFLRERRITVLDLPTAYWHEWVRDVALLGETMPPSVRLVVVGGERARPDALAMWRATSGERVRWLNTYGPTEGTVVATAWSPPPNFDASQATELPIGRPIANVRVYVLDQTGQPAPIGVAGELHIGGAGVARGYLRQPAITAERFVSDPFVSGREARMYKTGDLARYRPDGTIEFVGRIDEQVKVQGFRVEPGEIETALRAHEQIHDALVLAQDARLAAYVVTDEGAAPGAPELRAFLGDSLPPHMLPSVFVPLPELPMTANGKVDKAKLPAPNRSLVAASDYVAPRDEVEEKLAAIWAEVLGIKRVSATDNFFELGGHSLLAIRLFAVVESKFGSRLPLTTLFDTPRLDQLAERLRSGGAAVTLEAPAEASSLVEMKPGTRWPPLFLAPDLQGHIPLWYRALMNHLDPELPVYAAQSQGVDQRGLPHTRIEDMAAYHLNDIRSLQPEGPYMLAGHCFSGNVAYEMAQQLRAEGQKVAMLAIIDSVPYGHRPPMRGLIDVRAHINALFRDEEVDRRKYIARRVRRGQKRIARSIGRRTGWQPETTRLSPIEDVREAHQRAASSYVCKPYPGRITVFTVNRLITGEARWAPLAVEGVDCHIISEDGVDHTSVLREPHVRLLADLLNIAVGSAVRR